MIEVEVEHDAWTQVLPDVEARVRRAGEAALGKAEGEVVVLLSDDQAVRDLNARFRNKDKPTNVLSFPAAESAAPHLGDVVLAYGVCSAEAETQGKTLSDHLTHLVVHGVLHLLGRDHEDDLEAEEMEGEERAILADLGVLDPYRNDHAV
ncbi:rRNA maturation RNase YbeY [Brevundimonas sp. PAMC22021]|uniref:rRNA maturation RNase YbeY n=1 Tax=Brevundimonas sp. PAMC22021 TaxID=2861285 RepID=UPI001C624AD0|nr:rRNA maturation RNase YbeY [Brevundimonas sp. PAMC22021]QYF88404.1 rRNA maturation RNase YbeY [Brevundimonas sp. PAMC22021]